MCVDCFSVSKINFSLTSEKLTDQLLARLRGSPGRQKLLLRSSSLLPLKKIVTAPRPRSPLQPLQEGPLAEGDGGAGGGRAGRHPLPPLLPPLALLASTPRLQPLPVSLDDEGGEVGGRLPDEGCARQREGAIKSLLDGEHPGVI